MNTDTTLAGGATGAPGAIRVVAGRLFWGFACPQTVYTMMFTWIEARTSCALQLVARTCCTRTSFKPKRSLTAYWLTPAPSLIMRRVVDSIPCATAPRSAR